MKYVSTAAEVRELDRRAIELFGIPGVALMETAAHGVAQSIHRHHAEAAAKGVVFVCGPGNNGGDGYAAARWLYNWGYKVAVVQLDEPTTPDAITQREAAFRVGVPFAKNLGQPGLIVDAVFGTGLTRRITGRYAEALGAMAGLDVPCVAVDIPSGVDANTGACLGPVVPAMRTVTFARAKPAFLCGEGADLCGVVEVIDIGLAPGPELASAEIPEPGDLEFPRRAQGAHKGSSGHLVVVAGSERMTGAALLACRGALAGGAGLVTLVAPGGCGPRLAALPPEVMWICPNEGPVLSDIPEPALAMASAVVAGPGLGGGAPVGRSLGAALRKVWESHAGGVLFDADALPYTLGLGAGPRVITPHPGEAGRLLGSNSAEVQADRFAAARALAAGGKVALLKGRFSLVAKEGRRVSVNPTNHPALASGGTGDVLAGLAGALLARGLDDWSATRTAAYLHGRAGEIVGADCAGLGGASAVVEALPLALAELVP
ncbi:MAG: NAD(P)H-hydrate dehydratase [Proteobacteria bacterium]|nr:NAD(P)H-hydrate dehydratase [Pseudomonadota bacterium]